MISKLLFKHVAVTSQVLPTLFQKGEACFDYREIIRDCDLAAPHYIGTECIQRLVISAMNMNPDSKSIAAKVQNEHKGYPQEGIQKEPQSEQQGSRKPKE